MQLFSLFTILLSFFDERELRTKRTFVLHLDWMKTFLYLDKHNGNLEFATEIINKKKIMYLRQ